MEEEKNYTVGNSVWYTAVPKPILYKLMDGWSLYCFREAIMKFHIALMAVGIIDRVFATISVINTVCDIFTCSLMIMIYEIV